MQTLFGGSSGSTTTNNVTNSGFSQLPPEIQNSWKNLATQATNTIGTPSSAAPMFTPPPLSGPTTSALSQISNQAFVPTASSINSDIAMQTNPYDQSVIDTINREASGQGSQLSSYLTNAGQFGSNRGALSANDIDLTRLQQIGTFKNAEFQNALQNALTTLPQARETGAQGAVNAGLLTQQQQQQANLAPVSSLQALAQILGVSSGLSSSQSDGSSSGKNSANNGIFAPISDIRLKENIIYHGMENGHRIYDFNYIFDDEKTIYRGVMAQELLETVPDAVLWNGTHYSVDYSKLGIEFRRV